MRILARWDKAKPNTSVTRGLKLGGGQADQCANEWLVIVAKAKQDRRPEKKNTTRTHLQILGVRMVTWGKFNTEDPQILDTTGTKFIGNDDLEPGIFSLLKQDKVWTVQGVDWLRAVYTRAVRKVSSRSEYLENRSRCLDIRNYPIHNDRASSSASSRQCSCPSTALVQAFFWQSTSHHPGLSAPLHLRFLSQRLLAFPKAKIANEREEICECDGHTVHKLSQWRLTANWLAPRESDCSRIHSKVSSDWLPSYIKATRPVLEIFKMAGYFPVSPSIVHF